LSEKRETLRFTLPAPPGEERVPVDVPQLAIQYKMLKELRSIAEAVRRLEELLKARGEVLAITVAIEGARREVEPGYGLWRSISIHNMGPGECIVRLNRWDQPPVTVKPGESRSWSFLTPVVERVCIECLERSVLELEFTR